MGDRTGIAWTDHTFNPVWGCTPVSPACDSCYAEEWARRFGVTWGAHGTFREFGDKHWNEPLRWDRAAAKAGRRARVFCASMADVFDKRWPDGVRDRLWALIRATPNLDWQLLTKRPQNIARMLPADWGQGWPNVWLGTTVENQQEANRRVPHLLRVPAAVRFLSCEPLLQPVDLTDVVDQTTGASDVGEHHFSVLPDPDDEPGESYVDWVIVGGESGRSARPMHREWAEELCAQCATAGVPFFMKQVGDAWLGQGWGEIIGKGIDPAEWPSGLRVQEFPTSAEAP